jgi:hypothetical protein
MHASLCHGLTRRGEDHPTASRHGATDRVRLRGGRLSPMAAGNGSRYHEAWCGCPWPWNGFAQRLQKFGPPLLAINPLLTETQRGEQNGFVSLLKGLCGTIGNSLAHDPKVEWDMTKQDALDVLTTISLVHRKLDQAYRYRS